MCWPTETRTCCILTPTNNTGRRMVAALEALQAGHPERLLFQDQLRNAQPVRDVARLLAAAVKFCAQPTNMSTLADLREALAGGGAMQSHRRVAAHAAAQRAARAAVVSRAGRRACAARSVVVSAEEQRELARHRQYSRPSGCAPAALPIDQLVLTVAQDTLKEENDLAIAHSLAVSLRRYLSVNPASQLIDLSRQLEEIAANKQKYLSNSLLEGGFEPQARRDHGHDHAQGQRAGVGPGVSARRRRDRISRMPPMAGFAASCGLSAGTTRPPRRACSCNRSRQPGRAMPRRCPDWCTRAQVDYISERLRLLYVGVTRARSELMISYCKTRSNRDNTLALAVREVMDYAA